MPGHSLQCTLCSDSSNKRISPQLAKIYRETIVLKDEERSQRINDLIENYPPCAIARIAVVYQNQEFSDALLNKFGNSHLLLISCEYLQKRNSEGDHNLDHLKLFHLVGAVDEYLENNQTGKSDGYLRGGSNNLESIYGISLPEYELDQNAELSSFCSQESDRLRIISGKALPKKFE